MPDQAGIELILSAPDVKPIMDQVIDDWKEINRQEKLATEQLEKFNAEAEQHQLRLKEIALSNQKIKDALKDLEDARKRENKQIDENIDKQLFAQEHQQKGLLANIRGYFQQRKELGTLGKEIDNVNKQLRNLDLRQQAISLSARRGNTVAIKEYAANEKAIKSLNGTLNALIERENVVGAKLEITKQKFAGLTKVLSIVRTGALAASAAIALIGAVGLAAIIAIGKQNDQVKNVFEKNAKNFKKAKQELIDAFAPVAFTIGEILGKVATNLANFLSENGEAIFKWSVKLAGRVAFVSAYIGAFSDFVGNAIAKLTNDIKVSFEVLRLIADPTALFTGSLDKIDELLKKKAKLIDDTPINPIEAGNIAEEDAIKRLEELGRGFFKIRNLTDEQRKALEKLRAEYAKLTADISKQIEALSVKEAGPFAGVLLKAEQAAREIEALGEKTVSVAEKLGKSQKKINEIKDSVARLAKAVRDDAVKFLTDQAGEIVDKINEKLDELKAKRAGGEDAAKFKEDLEAQFKELKLFQQIQQTLIDNALNRGESVEIINELVAGMEKANRLAIDLANTTALDFFGKKAQEVLEKSKKEAEDRLAFIEKKGEQLRKALDSLGGSVETNKSISLQIKVNDIDLAVASEQIRQFEESFEIFKKTGVNGVVETEATIRLRIEGEQGINNIKPGDTSGQGVGGAKSPALSLTEGLDLAVGLQEIAFNTITDIALKSVDAQIEAIDRLVEARQNAVDTLQEQVQLEAQFKSEGLANDYDITKKRLEDAIKLEEAAFARQQELNAKRAKAQQLQDDLQTGSSLITAAANIIKGWSTVPLVGSLLGIAAAAGMLISFAATKIQARKLARAYKGSSRMRDTFGEFAPGEGYDDSPGHDRGLSVVDSKGQLRGFVGGDEYLHKQSVSRKHRGAFDYLNKNEDKFKDVNLLAMFRAMENSNIRPPFEMPDMSVVPHVSYSRIVAKNEKLRANMIVMKTGGGITKDELKEAVREVMKEHAQTMMQFHDSRPDIIPNEWFKDYTERTSKSSKKKKNL